MVEFDTDWGQFVDTFENKDIHKQDIEHLYTQYNVKQRIITYDDLNKIHPILQDDKKKKYYVNKDYNSYSNIINNWHTFGTGRVVVLTTLYVVNYIYECFYKPSESTRT